MNLSFFVARRYLFSKKSHSAINIISAVSALGIALATAALVCVLSVFNGFRETIGGLYSTFDPQIKVTPAEGKYAEASDPVLQKIRTDNDVAAAAECFEENALILFRGNPIVVKVKGVDDAYSRVTGLDSIVYNEANARCGVPTLEVAGINYALPAVNLASRMGLNFGKLQICAPRRGERINLANPVESFNVDDIFSTGTFFQVNQKRYDENYLITSLDFARRLFEQPGRMTSLELRLKPGADAETVKARLKAVAGGRYNVLTQAEQHEDTFKVMAIEKLMAYFFLTFIVLIACFNLIGSVAMLIIDKRANALIFSSLGMSPRAVSAIFLTESRLVTLLGAVGGIVLGLLLCWLQQTFGLISLGGGEGNFIIDAYPVSVHAVDVAVVLLTVVVVGFVTTWWPVRYLCRRML